MAHIDPNAPATLSNTATVAGGSDPNPHSATDVGPVVSVPLLSITKTHSGDFQPGQIGATYTISVNNTGEGPTSGTISVTDTVPTGLTATAISGTGWTCTLTTFTCTRTDALSANASYPVISVTVNVSSTAPSSVTNVATVSGGSDTRGIITAADDTNISPPTPPVVSTPALSTWAFLLLAGGLLFVVTRAARHRAS